MNLFKNFLSIAKLNYTNLLKKPLSKQMLIDIGTSLLATIGSSAVWIAIAQSKIATVVLGLAITLLAKYLLSKLNLSTEACESLQSQLNETEKKTKFITELALKFKREDILNDHFAPYCPKNNCHEIQMKFKSYSHSDNYYTCPNCSYIHELRNFDGNPSNVKDELEFVKWRLKR